jgi:hypothetical protein
MFSTPLNAFKKSLVLIKAPVIREEKRKEELDGGRAFDDSYYVHRLQN